MKKKFTTRLKNYIRSSNGFGVKEIAAALGFIVIVGLVIAAIQGSFLSGVLNDIWTYIKSFIDKNITK